MKRRLIFLILIAFIWFEPSHAQRVEPKKEQSAEVKEPMSDMKKATLLSLVPGGGQVYNHRVWKVPIIYAGFGALIYSFQFYNKTYTEVRAAYIESINKKPITNPEYANVSQDMLYNLRESYRKSRDLSVIGLAGWYAFNLIDAAVDAHLRGFDVSDKLSIKITPSYQYTYAGQYSGLKVQLKF